MHPTHPPPDTLERYVTGELEAPEFLWVEHHVEGCAACAAALRAEAVLEQQLGELGAALPSVVLRRTQAPPRATRRRRAALLLAAAALMLVSGAWLSRALLWPGQVVPQPQVRRCADQACVERAGFDGLIAVGPQNLVAVPRYDDAAPTPGSTPP